METINILDIVQAVGASEFTAPGPDHEINITGVEFDSRKIKLGDLFVPLTGGASDGHDYVVNAIEQGAVATFWSREADSAPIDQLAVIYVDDTLRAMQSLANYYRHLIDPIVIGITGSNGKTTTKDMMANALTAKYHIHKTEGNYNNEIGLPYTILSMPKETEVAVLEMGMSGFGEIALLSHIAEPDIAVITLIGESHLEFLGSRAGIAQAKLEILSGLNPEGVFIYPGAEPLITDFLEDWVSSVECISFGLEEDNDVYAYDIIEEKDQTYFKTNLDSNVICKIPVMGAYNVNNAVVALSVAKRLNVPIEQAIFQLAQFKLTASRLEWIQADNGLQVLNDAYNASPTSMKAVLQAFARLQRPKGGRRIAVLGDIRELGEKSEAYHRSIAEVIDPETIDLVYLFGDEMGALYEEIHPNYPSDQIHYIRKDHDRLIERIQASIRPEDIVLVKSSLGVDLLQVVTALTNHETHNFLRKE